MTDGNCLVCGQTYTKRGMNRHVRSCLPETGDGEDAVVLRVLGTHRDDYWIHTLLDEETTLATLDSFLRGFWLECCHHLSSFQVGSVDYENDNPGVLGSKPRGRGRSMDVALGTVLGRSGVDEFSYVYDWGSSTHLTLSVVETGRWDLSAIEATSEGDTSTGYDGLVLLTRNEPLRRECAACGDRAEHVCQACLMGRGSGARYCEDCAEDHDGCDRPRLLPVVNSPRSGVCGYTG